MGTEQPAPRTGQRPKGRIAALLADPPLIDRLTWREGISPQTLISRDRGLIARTFGSLFGIGAGIGFLLMAFGEDHGRDNVLIATIAAAAIVLAGVCFVGYRRLPIWFFSALMFVGTLMITGAAAGASEGAEAGYGFFYVWVVFLAFIFFTRPAASAHAIAAAVAYGTVMFVRDTPQAANLLIAAIATIGTCGALMGLLMARIERIAFAFSAEALTDPVTSIANRRDFDRRFEGAVARARRSGRPLSLIICDLDRFKTVNDGLGHVEGDVALRRAAHVISDAVRSMDAVARLGGEEFGIIVPDATAEAALEVAERVRTAIASEFADFPVTLTASCGVACTHETDSTDQSLFRAADMALYRAKREGRDRSVTYEGEPVPAIGASAAARD